MEQQSHFNIARVSVFPPLLTTKCGQKARVWNLQPLNIRHESKSNIIYYSKVVSIITLFKIVEKKSINVNTSKVTSWQ